MCVCTFETPSLPLVQLERIDPKSVFLLVDLTEQ